MKFKVSTKVKGSLILKSLGRAVSSGTTVCIEGDTLYADDVQRAIKGGLLVSLTPEDKIKVREEIINKTAEAVIVNKTDRVVIVGDFPIRPNGSAIKDISKLNMNAVRQCIENGLIQVITDIDEELSTEKKIELETGIDILEDTPSDGYAELAKLMEEADTEEEVEEEVKAGVWDARQQKMVKPQVVPKTGQRLLYDEDEEENIDMVDVLDEVNDIDEDEEIRLINDKIESMKKKLAQKKASKKKPSKKKTSKKKDNKVIKTKFTKESAEDIVQAIDSMGNPLVNDMTHMIDAACGKEISFCDQEHAQKKIEDARKQGNSINLDLD